jgi:peptide/nickel transport system ATP-binding protein
MTNEAECELISLTDAQVLGPDHTRPLLDIPELTIRRGERVVITGPSGAGKSLVLSTLMGRWAAGLRFTGTRCSVAQRIGFIPQRGLDALHPLTPLGRQLRRVTGCSREHTLTALAAVGLQGLDLRRRPTELSGGQAQRVAVALATLTRAPLLLADEPTSALDQASRDRTMHLLDSVVADDQALVVVTHDPAVARGLGRRRLYLDAGRLTEEHRTDSDEDEVAAA